MNLFFEDLKNKSVEIFLVCFLTFVPMWSIFLVNHYIFGEIFNSFGIHPRDLSFISLIQINTSWLLHSGFPHITGNTTILFPLILLLCIFESKPIKTLSALIFISGFFTWILGATNSVHVGASGLVFALFGYILSALFLARKFIYVIPVGIVGYFYSQSMLHGLIPQDSISFAAHFGGLIGGIVLGYFLNTSDKETKSSYIYKKTLKEKLASFVWDVKYRFNK